MAPQDSVRTALFSAPVIYENSGLAVIVNGGIDLGVRHQFHIDYVLPLCFLRRRDYTRQKYNENCGSKLRHLYLQNQLVFRYSLKQRVAAGLSSSEIFPSNDLDDE